MFDPPPVLDHWLCTLEAIDAPSNIARFYQIEASRDLFGHVLVCLRWGRIGRAKQAKTFSFREAEAARRFIERRLARRASAPARIGIPYVRTGAADPQRRSAPAFGSRQC